MFGFGRWWCLIVTFINQFDRRIKKVYSKLWQFHWENDGWPVHGIPGYLIFRQTSWKVLQHIQERTNWGILSLWPVYRRNRLLRRSHNLAKGIVKWKLRIVYSRMIVVSCTVLKKHPIFLLPKSLSHLQHSEDHPMISGFSSDQQNLDGPWFVLYLPLPKNISSSVGMIIPMEK